MKRILLLLIFLCIALGNSAWAQHPKGVFVGLSNQLSLRKLTLRTSTTALLGYQVTRHQLAAGPVMLTKDFSGTSNIRLISGLQLYYRYAITHQLERKIQWFASVTSRGLCFKENWDSNYWDVYKQAYTDVRQESRELLWENYAGIGFQYPWLSRLTLSASADFGYAFSKLQRSGLSPETADNEFDYRAYNPTEFVYAISMGMHVLLGHQP